MECFGICFSQKNKTLSAIFKQKKILSLLEKNCKTLQALQQSQISLEEMNLSTLGDNLEVLNLDMDDGREDDDEMDVEVSDAESMADAEEKVSGFKDKVLGLLKQYDYENKRSSKLTQNEFIHLLSVFNPSHTHFT
ncbi:hypothetical protein Ancab_022493 [Ancistrocladus abbreviatus]